MGTRPLCGIDIVEIARIERLTRHASDAELLRIFSARELCDAGDGPGRVPSLAARFAAKEACLKLFPRETALQRITVADFSVARDNFGAPQVTCSNAADTVLGLYRVQRISLSLSHDRSSACAVALAESIQTPTPLSGRIINRLFPYRRSVITSNLRRAYGDRVPEAEIARLTQAHYGHLWRLIAEFLGFPLVPDRKRPNLARVENIEALFKALETGKGAIVLTGHFGNFEVATAAGINWFPEGRGRLYFLRRPFKPRWLDDYVTRRFRRAGFGVLPRRGSLDWLLERLAAEDVVVFPFDQHAAGRDGIRVEFFGHPAGTFRSLALVAHASGAPVVPAACWRESAPKHVLRFEDALPHIERADFDDEMRANTRSYNAALERLVVRHPEQWWWVHRRWKVDKARP